MNSLKTSTSIRNSNRQQAELEFARRLTAGLGGHNPRVPADIERRLSASRWQAVEAATRARRLKAMTAAASLASASGHVSLTPWWARFASLVPALALTLGLIAIDQMNLMQRIEAAAEIDAALLADDLPPAAYADPGFAEFMKQPRP